MPPRKTFRPDKNQPRSSAERKGGERGGGERKGGERNPGDRPSRGPRDDRNAAPGKSKFGKSKFEKPKFEKSGGKGKFSGGKSTGGKAFGGKPFGGKPGGASHRSEDGRRDSRRDEGALTRKKDFVSQEKPQRQVAVSKENIIEVPHPPRAEPKTNGAYWIYGHHVVLAAIDNPRRKILRLVQAGERTGERAALGGGERPLPRWETIDRPGLDRLAGKESVHQGIAAQVEPLAEFEIEDLVDLAADRPDAVVVILDQVTDPHNVGAILRSAAAFGALAVLLTERHAAPETGVLAKAASGALDVTPLVRVANLARAMEQLKEAGFWCVGLAGEADRTLAQANLTGKIALCLGAEGPGLRRLTRTHCDLLAKLPTSGPIGHLNVSNAAAVSLYELARSGAD